MPVTAQARAHTHPLGVARSAPQSTPSPAAGDYGLRPQDLHSAYQLPTEPTNPQTIAIVDAYNDPTAQADLAGIRQGIRPAGMHRRERLPAPGQPERRLRGAAVPGVAEGARRSPQGAPAQAERAEAATGWGLELSLDMETAHAVCQTCTILLVLANSEDNDNLEAAERSAEALGANEITNSWGGLEEGESAELESESAFNHPGTVITASAGDDGYLGWDCPEQLRRRVRGVPLVLPARRGRRRHPPDAHRRGRLEL